METCAKASSTETTYTSRFMPKSRGGTLDEKGQWHTTENRLVLPFWKATMRCGHSSATTVDNEESRKALTSRAATFSGTAAREILGAGKSEARAARHTERAVICEKQMDMKAMLEQKPCPFLAQMRELCVRFHAFFHRFTCGDARYFRRIRHLAYSCLEIARIRPTR